MKIYKIKNWNFIIAFCLTIAISDSAFSVNLTGSGITTPPATHGLYLPTRNNSSVTGSVNSSVPDISIKGNSVEIADGDVTPDLSDNTDFGSAVINGASVIRTFTIENNSESADLNLTGPVTINGANASDFIVTKTPFPQIGIGSPTDFAITFSPSAPGLRTAEISIANNDPDENPYNFSIQGTGTTPEKDVQGNGNSINDGDLSPSSDDHTDFRIQESLPVPEMEVQGNSITIADGDYEPSLPDGTNFGPMTFANGTVVQTFTILNTGTATLSLTGSYPYVVINGTNAADFTVTTIPSQTIAAGDFTTFEVTFNPSALFLRQAEIIIENNDSDETTYNFNIEGTGTAPEMDVQGMGYSISDGDLSPSPDDHTDFGQMTVATGTVERTFTILNTGTSELSLTSFPYVLITGANAEDFTVTINPISPIVNGSPTDFQITFNPSATGLRTAEIHIYNDDSDENPYDFRIQGTGTAPEIEVQGNSITINDGDNGPSLPDGTNFGPMTFASGTVVHTFTVMNTGTSILTLNTPTITGTNAADFSVSAAPSTTIAAGDFTTFQVTFDPSALYLRMAEISIENNDSDETTYNFSIEGTGTEPEIDVKGNSMTIVDGDATPSLDDYTDFGSMTIASGTITRNFLIQNLGNSDLTLTGASPYVIISGTNAADFTVSQIPQQIISNSTAANFQVTFDPSALGLRSANISIANDDSDENPYNFSIQGTGTGPEINVKGNNINITDGDVTPSLTDHTDFGSAELTGGTVVRTFTVQNTGTAILFLTGSSPYVTIGGANAADFSVTSNPVNGIAVAGSTTFDITFNPSAAGIRSAEISLANDDADENPFNFSVQGTGVFPEIEIRGNNVIINNGSTTPSLTDYTDFGSTLVASGAVVRSYAIINLGTSTLRLTGPSPYFTISGPNASDFTLSPMEPSPEVPEHFSTYLRISFDPSGIGTRTAEITIPNNDDDENPFTFAIQGTGLEPEMDVRGNGVSIADGSTFPTPTDHTYFDLVPVASGSVVRTFTIYNTGNSPLSLTEPAPFVTISGAEAGDFSLSFAPAYLINGGSTTIFQINFDPSSPGVRNAEVSIANDDNDENPYNFSIQGFGAVPEINVLGNSTVIPDGDSSPSIGDDTDFGATDVTSGTITKTFMIQNTGSSVLTLTGSSPYVSITGANAGDFTVTKIPSSSIDPSGLELPEITFDPSGPGLRTAEVSISSDDTDENLYNFSIQGTGLSAPVVTTQAVSDIGEISATGNGNITDMGYPGITSHGICWNSTGMPTKSENMTDNGPAGTTGAFTALITGLSPGETYYVRAFATNSEGTGYGSEQSFVSDFPTGIADINSKTVRIYPNPAIDEFIIEIAGNNKRTDFEIHNSAGQIVFRGSMFEKTIVKTTIFPAGVYLVKIQKGKTFVYRKIVKR